MKSLFKTFSLIIGGTALLAPVPMFAATNYVAFGGPPSVPSTVDYNFRPSSLTIHVGDTVIWTNAGGFHTVTGLNTNEPLCGTQAPVQVCTNTFNIPGVFAYECSIHHGAPWFMTGLVNVVGAPLSPAVLTNAYWTNGDLVFKVLSTANQTNIIQAATNLVSASNWVSLGTNMPASNAFIFTDTNATRFPRRFYRVIEP